MLQAFCAVCLEVRAIDKFRVLRCGHCYCSDPCIKNLRTHRGTSSCPECRAPIKPQDEIPLHMHLVASTSTQPVIEADPRVVKELSDVTDMIDHLDKGATAKELKNAGESMKDVALRVLDDHGVIPGVHKLLEAVQAFTKRVVPILWTNRAQFEELEWLRDRLATTENSLTTAAKAMERSREGERIQKKKQEDMLKMMEMCQERWSRLNDEMQALVSKNTEMEEEVKKYKGLLTQRNNVAKSQRVVIKRLQAEVNRLEKYRGDVRTEDSQHPNESLVVIPEDYDLPGIELPSLAPELDINRPTDNEVSWKHEDTENVAEAQAGRLFSSDWQLSSTLNPKKPQPFNKAAGAIKVDAKGHVLGPVQLGSRVRMRK